MADDGGRHIVARNRKARHDYEVLETFEAGIVLKGPEVKSVRAGKIQLAESFARIEQGEVWLHGAHISPYGPATIWNEEPTRPRKLLLTRSELRRLVGKVEEKGLTLVPLEVHFRRGYAKLALGLCRGRRAHDRRHELRRREQEREMQRELGKRR
jgi:SsrA-binding protein